MSVKVNSSDHPDLTLSEGQIWNLAQGNGINLKGVYAKDKLPTICQGKFVINLQSSTDGNGTHWVALKTDGKKGTYFDSFGQPPPVEVLAVCPDLEHNTAVPHPHARPTTQDGDNERWP